MKEVNDHEH